jgi:hypothetical protein
MQYDGRITENKGKLTECFLIGGRNIEDKKIDQ